MQALRASGGLMQHLRHPLTACWQLGDTKVTFEQNRVSPDIIVKSLLFSAIPLVINRFPFSAKIIFFKKRNPIVCAGFFFCSFYLLTLARKVQVFNEAFRNKTESSENKPKVEARTVSKKEEAIHDLTVSPPTPLYLAVKNRQIEKVKEILSQNLDALEVPDSNGRTPIILCFGSTYNEEEFNLQQEIALYLLSKGAKQIIYSKIYKEIFYTNQLDIYVLAVMNGHEKVVKKLHETRKDLPSSIVSSKGKEYPLMNFIYDEVFKIDKTSEKKWLLKNYREILLLLESKNSIN